MFAEKGKCGYSYCYNEITGGVIFLEKKFVYDLRLLILMYKIYLTETFG